MSTGRRDARDRFYASFTVDPAGCWLWRLRLSPKGYGILWDGRVVRAHRFSYSLHFGSIDPGVFVCHACDVRNCVNPWHLFAGDNDANTSDRHVKGRTVRGSQQGSALLTERQVAVIKVSLARGWSQVELGKKFGVSKSTIWDIAHGRGWGHVR